MPHKETKSPIQVSRYSQKQILYEVFIIITFPISASSFLLCLSYSMDLHKGEGTEQTPLKSHRVERDLN